MDMSLSKVREIVKDKGAWWATAHGVSKESDMTEHEHSHSFTNSVFMNFKKLQKYAHGKKDPERY